MAILNEEVILKLIPTETRELYEEIFEHVDKGLVIRESDKIGSEDCMMIYSKERSFEKQDIPKEIMEDVLQLIKSLNERELLISYNDFRRVFIIDIITYPELREAIGMITKYRQEDVGVNASFNILIPQNELKEIAETHHKLSNEKKNILVKIKPNEKATSKIVIKSGEELSCNIEILNPVNHYNEVYYDLSSIKTTTDLWNLETDLNPDLIDEMPF